MNRHLVLLFVLILTAPILAIVKPAYSAISTPSAPEFTATITDSSEYVPKVYSLDRSTGDIVADDAYIAVAKKLHVAIVNQPFTPYRDDVSERDIHFYYNVRIKIHNSETWNTLYRASEGFPGQHTDSQYTTITRTLKYSGTNAPFLVDGAQIDVQVAAMIGYIYRDVVPIPGAGWGFEGETVWSKTQTVTVPDALKIVTPEIDIFSPYNVSYSRDNVSLVFGVTGESSWMGYSIDGSNIVTLRTKTLNLTKLNNGSHTITVYANGTYPDTETAQTIAFTVNKEKETEPQPEPQQPNPLIVAVSMTLVAIAATAAVGLRISRTKDNNH